MDPHDAFEKIMEEMRMHVAGKKETIELLFICLISNGHALLEGVPGVAKTTTSKTLAAVIEADFKRIQGTPDLEPRDITGYTYVDDDGNVKFNKGPVFTNVLLIDEINRMQPKTMSALLETLEERQVSVGGESTPLPAPFTSFATQNPLNIEGTVALPKVLADRFLMKIDVGYPTIEEEKEMIRLKEKGGHTTVNKVMSINDVLEMQEKVDSVELPDDVIDYIAKIINATRKDIHVVMGASPRADMAFMRTAKAKALIEGRSAVTIDDIKALAKPVLGHRIVVRASGGIGVNGIIDGIVATLK